MPTTSPTRNLGAEEGALFLRNPNRSQAPLPEPTREPLEFHGRLPGYRPTRLVSLDAIAAEHGLDRLWLKDESQRLGLPAFKVVGVSWAAYRALVERLGETPAWETVDDLRDAFAALRPLTLVSATSGNHGRALARVSHWFGLGARIFVPADAPPERIAAIGSEGAEVVEVEGGYDAAVEAASAWIAAHGEDEALLVSDTANDPSERIPASISDGYSTIFWEIDDRLREDQEPEPDLVVVQIGVGALALAAAQHYRRPAQPRPAPRLVGVETRDAACLLESARAGEFRIAPGPHRSQMFCLNAGVPSRTGLDRILAGFDGFVAVGDEAVGSSARALAEAGVVSGPTGTAGLVGLGEILARLPRDEQPRRALIINTEGAADPSGYAASLLPEPGTVA